MNKYKKGDYISTKCFFLLLLGIGFVNYLTYLVLIKCGLSSKIIKLLPGTLEDIRKTSCLLSNIVAWSVSAMVLFAIWIMRKNSTNANLSEFTKAYYFILINGAIALIIVETLLLGYLLCNDIKIYLLKLCTLFAFMIVFYICGRLIIDIFIDIYLKYKEVWLYLYIGGLTTLINLIIYNVFNSIGVYYIISNVIAWVAAVIFAFYTNKLIVFQSEKGNNDKKEFIMFIICRIGSLVAETIFLLLLVDICNFSEGRSKIFTQVLVVVLNYFFSKFWIFKN